MREYICLLCNKNFDDNRQKYWNHVNRKTLCIPKERVLDQLNEEKGKTKLCATLTEENQRLKEKLELFEELAKEKEKQQVINFNNNISNFDFSTNNNLTMQNLNNETDVDKYFNIDLNRDKEQTLDHIPVEMYLEILKSKTVDKSLTQIVRTVYFHPKAPENHTWCVVDKKAKSGSVYYSHDLNQLITSDTNDTIERNVQNVIPKVLDIMTGIQKKVPFNRKQEQNYHGLYQMYGNSLDLSTINEIKNMAYEDRDIPRAVWRQLCISMVKSIEK